MVFDGADAPCLTMICFGHLGRNRYSVFTVINDHSIQTLFLP